MTICSSRTGRLRRILKQAVLLFLLIAIPKLSTLAKTSWYLPQADAGHFLTGAIKMKVTHASAIPDLQPVQAMVKLALPEPLPQIQTNRPAEPEPKIPSIGVTVSLQYRSPPSPQRA